MMQDGLEADIQTDQTNFGGQATALNPAIISNVSSDLQMASERY